MDARLHWIKWKGAIRWIKSNPGPMGNGCKTARLLQMLWIFSIIKISSSERFWVSLRDHKRKASHHLGTLSNKYRKVKGLGRGFDISHVNYITPTPQRYSLNHIKLLSFTLFKPNIHIIFMFISHQKPVSTSRYQGSQNLKYIYISKSHIKLY